MNKEPFNLKTIKNLLDMIQNRDYIIEELEFKMQELDMMLASDTAEKGEFIEKLWYVVSSLKETGWCPDCVEGINTIAESLERKISDYE